MKQKHHPKHQSRRPSRTDPYLFFGIGVFGAVSALTILLVLFTELPLVLSVFVAANVVGVFVMGLDKNLSRGSSLRIPEAVLFFLALLGGALGIFLGIQMVRHKTQKAFFHFVLFLIFAAQLGVYTLVKGGLEQ